MASYPSRVCLYYSDDAYSEPAPGRPATTAMGLMGRHVAGSEFLNAYLGHGRFDELVALVRDPAGARSFEAAWASHAPGARAARKFRVVSEQAFHRDFVPNPPAPVLHTPQPPDPKFAWVRQRGFPGRLSLTGVTHTLASLHAVETLGQYLIAPFEPYDCLICTSEAVLRMVRTVTGTLAEYLRERHGGSPALRMRLEMIPLGVDPEKFRPPTADERAASRRGLGIADDEVAVLFVGRLSFHAKAHPYPIYDGLARAARAAGRKVHLILAGWAANEAIRKAFEDGARVFAPGLRVSIVDGTAPGTRRAIWQAADVFTSLSDNIQETFGLVITEAMAAGLPVVASDWDGYRDQVVDGETGYLVPTYMVRGATSEATSRLILGEINYDHFLCECNQAVTVDPAATAEAYARLIADDSLRRRMGEAGRRRAAERFAWTTVVRAYEALWAELEAEQQAAADRGSAPRAAIPGPSLYPEPEHTFAGYPTALLEGGDRIVADENARERLGWLLDLPLTNYEARCRSADAEVLRSVLAAAASPVAIEDLDGVLARAGLGRTPGRATIAWMLKYGLLRTIAPGRPGPRRGDEGERVETDSEAASPRDGSLS